MWSAEFYPDDQEEETPSKFEQWLEKRFGSEGLMKWIIGIAVAAGIAFAIALIHHPAHPVHLRPALLLPGCPHVAAEPAGGRGEVGDLLLLPLLLLPAQGHSPHLPSTTGAEHKTIFCYERGLELTVENARKMPRHHPRCGTSFLFVVIVVAVLASCVVFALPGIRDVAANPLVRILLHLVLLPIVVAITYEINRFIGRHDNPVTGSCRPRGMWMQNLPPSSRTTPCWRWPSTP